MAGRGEAQQSGEAPGAGTLPPSAAAVPQGARADGPRRRGRRPGGSDTRGEILAAARAELAQRGFDGATVRAVARRAGVDPALVRHYFDDKAELFAAAMVPAGVDPAHLVPALLAGGPDGLGERLARAVLELWEDEQGETFRALFAALGSSEPHLRAMAGFLGRQVFTRVGEALPGPDVELRVSLVVSHVAGLLVGRHVMRLPYLATLGTEQLAALVGPTLQAYLTGPLPQPVPPDPSARAALSGPSVPPAPEAPPARQAPDGGAEPLAENPTGEDYSSHGE